MTELENDSEILFRQIHPSFIQDGLISSQPFYPTSKDDDKLSVDRESMTTPAAAFALFIAKGRNSAAVYGLSVGEFGQEKLDCYADPVEASDCTEANPAHAVVDYGAHTTSERKNKAKRLKIKAIARGVLHPSPKVGL
jgi:hypothetical protein